MLGDAALIPGWFGKLPGIGDFAHRRLPEGFRNAWDAWLQGGLASLRERHEDWVARYLEGPVWFFVLAAEVVGPRAWVGVLIPSVDGVGRYFPFTVATEMPFRSERFPARQWWALAAQAALTGLEQDLDAVGFDAELTRLFQSAPWKDAELGSAAADEVPWLSEQLQTLWCMDPRAATPADGDFMVVDGLPRGENFDALFGFGSPTTLRESR